MRILKSPYWRPRRCRLHGKFNRFSSKLQLSTFLENAHAIFAFSFEDSIETGRITVFLPNVPTDGNIAMEPVAESFSSVSEDDYHTTKVYSTIQPPANKERTLEIGVQDDSTWRSGAVMRKTKSKVSDKLQADCATPEDRQPIIRILPTYKAQRGGLVQSTGWYDGVLYRNHFKVGGGPIYLLAVGFFGPPIANCTYNVNLEVRTLYSSSTWNFHNLCCPPPAPEECPYRVRLTTTAMARKGETFQVRLQKPLLIPPNLWMEIGFSIFGQEVLSCLKAGSQSGEDYLKTELGHREFQFLRGSGQMSHLEFSVKDPSDSSSYVFVSKKVADAIIRQPVRA